MIVESIDSLEVKTKRHVDSQRARQNYVCRAQEKFDCDSTSPIRDTMRATDAARLATRLTATHRRIGASVAERLRAFAPLTSNA
jgi:hypothetical protein